MAYISISDLQSKPAESFGFSTSMGVKDDVVLTKGEKSYHFDYSKDAALFLLGYEVAKGESSSNVVDVNISGDAWAVDLVDSVIGEIYRQAKNGKTVLRGGL